MACPAKRLAHSTNQLHTFIPILNASKGRFPKSDGTKKLEMKMNIVSTLQEARKLISDGLVCTAAEVLEEIVEEQPGNHDALKLMSRAYLILNDQDSATACLRKLHGARKDNQSPARGQQFDSNDASYVVDSASGEQEYSPALEYEVSDSAGTPDIEVGFVIPEEMETEVDAESGTFEHYEIEGPIGELATSSEETEVWESIILDDLFVDVEDEQIDFEEVEYTGRLTPIDRARQIVAEMALENPIEEELFDVLVECLAFHKCHGQTRMALHNLMAQYPAASELALVFELRAYWKDREAFFTRLLWAIYLCWLH